MIPVSLPVQAGSSLVISEVAAHLSPPTPPRSFLACDRMVSPLDPLSSWMPTSRSPTKRASPADCRTVSEQNCKLRPLIFHQIHRVAQLYLISGCGGGNRIRHHCYCVQLSPTRVLTHSAVPKVGSHRGTRWRPLRSTSSWRRRQCRGDPSTIPNKPRGCSLPSPPATSMNNNLNEDVFQTFLENINSVAPPQGDTVSDPIRILHIEYLGC